MHVWFVRFIPLTLLEHPHLFFCPPVRLLSRLHGMVSLILAWDKVLLWILTEFPCSSWGDRLLQKLIIFTIAFVNLAVGLSAFRRNSAVLLVTNNRAIYKKYSNYISGTIYDIREKVTYQSLKNLKVIVHL